MRTSLSLVAAVLLFAASAALAAQDKVDICHIPPGNPSAAHLITVGAAAVPAHVAHGDLVFDDNGDTLSECVCSCMGQFVECESECEVGSTCDAACREDLRLCRLECVEG